MRSPGNRSATKRGIGLIAVLLVASGDVDAPNFNDSAAAQVETAPDGSYQLTGLAAIPYVVLFSDCSKAPVYALEFYDGGTGTADPAEATQIDLKDGGRKGIDAALGFGGSISGGVFQLPTNTPIENRCVVVFSPGFGSLGITRTDANGAYQLGGLPTGQWYVAAGECDSEDESDGEFVWYAGATSVAVTVADNTADPVGDGAKLVTVVTGAETRDINLYFGLAGGSTTPTDPAPTDDAAAANTGSPTPLSGSLPRTGVPGPDMAIVGGLLLGLGLLVVRISEVRRAR